MEYHSFIHTYLNTCTCIYTYIQTVHILATTTGRCSFARKLHKPAESVQWHPSGQYYILTASKEWQVTLYIHTVLYILIIFKEFP